MKKLMNTVYWIIHNEIAVPVLVLSMLVIFVMIAPFYVIGNYFYRYHRRVNEETKT